jgi:hypothetical protein
VFEVGVRKINRERINGFNENFYERCSRSIIRAAVVYLLNSELSFNSRQKEEI